MLEARTLRPAVALLMLLLLVAPTAAAGIGIRRVAWATDGSAADGDTGFPTISRDGNDIAFISAGSNLVRNDTNGGYDVFVHDVSGNRSMRVSLLNLATAGKDPSEGSGIVVTFPFISGDGDYVVWTWSTDLRPVGLSGFKWQIWEWYRPTNETGVLTRAANGGAGNDNSIRAIPAHDGRHVAFSSDAMDLTGQPDPFGTDIYLYDGQLPHRHMSFGMTSAGNSFNNAPFLAGNARTVGFGSERDDVVAGDGNGKSDLFVRDSQTLVAEALTLRPDGKFAADPGWQVGTSWLAHAGDFAVFSASSSELVPNDTNNEADVFVRDIVNDRTTRVSVDKDGRQANGASNSASISADGRYVVFTSFADDLLPEDPDNLPDLYLKDLRTGDLRLLRFEPYGAGKIYPSNYMLDEDGSRIVFEAGDNGWFPAGRQPGATDAVFVADIADVLAARGVIQSRIDTATPGSSASVPAGVNLEEVVVTRDITVMGEGGSVVRGATYPAMTVARTNARLVDLRLETSSMSFAALRVRDVPLLELENVTGTIDADRVGWARVAKNVSEPEPTFGATQITYANFVTFRATWSDGSAREGATVRLHDGGVNWYSGRTNATGEVTLPVAYATRTLATGQSTPNSTIVTIDGEPTVYGAVNPQVAGMHLPSSAARPPTPPPGPTPTPGPTTLPGFPTPTIVSGNPSPTPAGGPTKPTPGPELGFVLALIVAVAVARAARRR